MTNYRWITQLIPEEKSTFVIIGTCSIIKSFGIIQDDWEDVRRFVRSKFDNSKSEYNAKEKDIKDEWRKWEFYYVSKNYTKRLSDEKDKLTEEKIIKYMVNWIAEINRNKTNIRDRQECMKLELANNIKDIRSAFLNKNIAMNYNDEEQIIVDAINKKFQPKKPNSK